MCCGVLQKDNAPTTSTSRGMSPRDNKAQERAALKVLILFILVCFEKITDRKFFFLLAK